MLAIVMSHLYKYCKILFIKAIKLFIQNTRMYNNVYLFDIFTSSLIKFLTIKKVI